MRKLSLLLLAAVSASGQESPLGSPPPPGTFYGVGPNYHATTGEFLTDAFISQYHEAGVRSTVQAQLATMAADGANLVKTTLWEVGDDSETWRLGFPIPAQQLTNIHDYATDVAATQLPNGKYMTLQLALGRLGCADYTIGTPATTIGWCDLSWATFVSIAKQDIDNLLAQVANVMDPLGKRVVSTLYMEIEVMIGAKANQDQMMLDIYPYFLTQCAAAGVNGSVYFLAVASEEEVMDDDFEDDEFPVLDGHRSLFWVYRSTAWMTSNGLPVPSQIDMSFYPEPLAVSYANMVDRLVADLQVVYPGSQYGIAETQYVFEDEEDRTALGRAYSNSFRATGQPRHVLFWSTPYHLCDPLTSCIGPPFDIAAYSAPFSDGFEFGTTAAWSSTVP